MRRFLAAALVALLPFGAASQQRDPDPERWVYAKAQGGALGYEATTILKDEAAGEAYGFSFLYLIQPLTAQGVTYSYQLRESEYDCRGRRYKLLSFVLFDAKGMELDTFDVSAPEWMPAPSNGAQQLLIQIFCDAAQLNASRERSTMESGFADAAVLARE